MLSREVIVTLPGTPAAKGSMKCVGRNGHHQLVASNAKPQKLWHDAIVQAMHRYVGEPADKGQAIGVEVTFTIKRPQIHFGSGRNASFLAHHAPEFATARRTNDVDKLTRLLLDALQDSHVIVDDAQVVEIIARKSYELLNPDALILGPKPPHWVTHETPAPDVLSFSGARIRIYPVKW